MQEPELVAELVSAMGNTTAIPVSVKCRLGVDEHDSQSLLEAFIGTVADAGCNRFYVHARKALLNGISPAQNRQIPPLEYDRVYRLKQHHPELTVILNGGVVDLDGALAHLEHVDGLMIGRQAYHQPLFVNDLASQLFGEPLVDAYSVMARYTDYMADELCRGTRLADMTRHCLGLFAGIPGARHYRRLLSDQRRLRDNDLSVVAQALDCMRSRAA